MGINHLAPTCRDMKETVDFYSGVLGMPLICTTAAGPPTRCSSSTPGTAPLSRSCGRPTTRRPHRGSPRLLGSSRRSCSARATGHAATEGAEPATKGTAVGALNHIALNVAPEKIEEYREKLRREGDRRQPGREPRGRPIRPVLSVPAARPGSTTRSCSCARSTSTIRTASSWRSPAGVARWPRGSGARAAELRRRPALAST